MDQEPKNASDQEIKDLIKEVLLREVEDKKNKVSKKRLASALAGTLDEFLSSYILLGYDLDGKDIAIKSAKNAMQNEALKSFLIKYVAYTVHGYED